MAGLPSVMPRRYFYPRSPCGERRHGVRVDVEALGISIHVPLAGNVTIAPGAFARYLSISIHVPLAGNVSSCLFMGGSTLISIHVPLAGNVTNSAPAGSMPVLFLSTFPLRGTSRQSASVHPASTFLSTFPLRGTSLGWYKRGRIQRISIHVPLAGNVGKL